MGNSYNGLFLIMGYSYNSFFLIFLVLMFTMRRDIRKLGIASHLLLQEFSLWMHSGREPSASVVLLDQALTL